MSERPKVKSIDKMDNETFLKHMNHRHKGAAGISHYGKSNVPGDEDEHLLRMMHEVLHTKPHYKTDHDHGNHEESK